MNILAITKHADLVERLRTAFEGAGNRVLHVQDHLDALASEAWSQAQLILVDAGKGGLCVTSVVAGLGDALAAHGKRVLTIDLDMETQDLSRFLQTRPFVNENLQLLLEEQRRERSGDRLLRAIDTNFRVADDIPVGGLR